MIRRYLDPEYRDPNNEVDCPMCHGAGHPYCDMCDGDGTVEEHRAKLYYDESRAADECYESRW